MKNFFELLDTEYYIAVNMVLEFKTPCMANVQINDQLVLNQFGQHTLVVASTVPLLHPLDIKVQHSGVYVSSLQFDGWESRPHWGQENPGLWHFTTNKLPFYLWKHLATGQGWLLEPKKCTATENSINNSATPGRPDVGINRDA